MKETMTEDGNKLGWANSFIKLSRHEIKFGFDSILDTTATPQRLKQWGVKEYRSGLTTSVRFARKRREPLDTCDVALVKTESSFNRIAWRHDKVLQTARAKPLEHSKLIKTKGYQLMADLDKNRHDFLQTLRSFDSKLKPEIVLIK
jgi:hypothetical protein